MPSWRRPLQSTFEERQLQRAFDRKKMLKRREVPRESETLLTWSAMDQIRQLHERDPLVWTPEQIARSFSVSAEGARRLLSNLLVVTHVLWSFHGLTTGKKPPTTFSKTDVQKHDRAVNQRWQELTQDDDVKKGYISKRSMYNLMPVTRFFYTFSTRKYLIA